MNSLMIGSTGYAVESLQEMLSNCGYSIDVTGTYDELTKRTVCRFQEKEKIAVTGVADERTLTILAMRAAVAH